MAVRSSTSFTRSTARYVVGEVCNGRASAVSFIKVGIKFYDGANTLVAVEETYTFLTRTNPGEVNPFKAILSNAPASIVRYEFVLSWQTSSGLDYRPVTIISQSVRDNYGVEVFGEVRNDQNRELRGTELAVTFYDAAGNVVDTDFGFPSSTTIAPGAISPYRVSTFEDTLVYNSFNMRGQGYLAP